VGLVSVCYSDDSTTIAPEGIGCRWFICVRSLCANGQQGVGSCHFPFLQGLDVSINGVEPIQFGLDTGLAASAFSIAPEQARMLILPVIGRRRVPTSDKQPKNTGAETELVLARNLTVAGHTFQNVEGVVMPGKSTLGIRSFRKILLTLDYPRGCLSISDGALPAPNGSDITAYTTVLHSTFLPLRFSPNVSIQLAGHAFPALLDTGAAHISADIIVPIEIAERLPHGPVIADTIIADSFGRKYPSRTAHLNGDLIVGEIRVHDPDILVSGWLGFIDLAAVINRMVITIDQRNHRLRIIDGKREAPHSTQLQTHSGNDFSATSH
jgi:hypothetical protein